VKQSKDYNVDKKNYKVDIKALHYKLFLLRPYQNNYGNWQLRQQLLQLKLLSFVNVNNWGLTINKQFLTKMGGNNEFLLPDWQLKIGLKIKDNH